MDIAELQNQYRSEKGAEVRERILMMIWLKKGKTTYEVADLLSCPQSKVMYWKTRFERENLNGLKTRPRSGKPPKLSTNKAKVIKQKLELINCWQTRWVSDLIEKETGVIYSQRHVVRLLHKWGFEQITPRKEHEKASEKERKEFKKKQERYWTRCQKDGMWYVKTNPSSSTMLKSKRYGH